MLAILVRITAMTKSKGSLPRPGGRQIMRGLGIEDLCSTTTMVFVLFDTATTSQ